MTNDRNEPRSPSCEDHEAHLSAYVLGELDVLSDDDRASLEAHLESCERCRAEEALLRRTVEAVALAGGALSADEAARLETDRRDAVLSQAAEAVTVSGEAEKVTSITELEQAFKRAKKADRTSVIVIDTDAHEWTPGDACWDVGVPEVSDRAEVRKAHAEHSEGRKKQRVGI